MICVYILKGDRYYIGSTNNLDRRIAEHRRGKTHTTKRIGNRELIKIIETLDLKTAKKLERKIKNSGHVERYI